MATDIRTPYPYVFSMAYYTLTRILSKYTLMSTYIFERTKCFS